MPRSRRGRGEGAIFKRSNGRWYATASLGSTIVDGHEKRIRREVSGKTKTEVQQRLAAIREERNGTGDATLTVGDWLDRHLAAKSDQVRSGTHAQAEIRARVHIKPFIGYMLLRDLTPSALQHFYSTLATRGRSATVRNGVHGLMFNALKAAVRQGLIQRNVAELVDPPRVTRAAVQPLTRQQARALVMAASETSPRLHAIVLLAITTGMRQGELFALQRDDLDLVGATINVRGTLYEDGTVGPPKTARSRRRIDLSPNAVTILTEYLRDSATDSPFLFTAESGTPIRKSNFRKREWYPLCQRAGLPRLKFHNLRHTSATLSFSRSTHPKIVQERLGHANIGITLDTYSAFIPGMGRAEAGEIDSILDGGD